MNLKKRFFKLFHFLLVCSIIAIIPGCFDSGDDDPPVSLSSAKALSSFSFSAADNSSISTNVVGAIDEDASTITLIVPGGTEIDSLIAQFTTTGESVTVDSAEQESGVTSIDFSDPVLYTVAAEDGTTRNYTVTVLNDGKSISAFTFEEEDNSAISEDVVGTIDEDTATITLNVPGGTDITSLVARFTTTGESVNVDSEEQTSGTSTNDFSSAVTYTAVAEDSTTKNYTVSVVLQVPANLAGSISFTDEDVTDAGQIGGDVSINNANDESDITHYVLYWGSNDTTKLPNNDPIATLDKNESLSHTFEAETVMPDDAKYFLVFTKNDIGEMATGKSIEIEDKHYPIHEAVSGSFTDTAIFEGLEGDIVITPALNESDITHYALYWGTLEDGLLRKWSETPIAVFEKTEDLTHPLPFTTVNWKVQYILIYTRNGELEMESFIDIPIVDEGGV